MTAAARLLLPALLLVGCEKKVVGDCSEDQPCEGFATCVEGECILKKCSVNQDCGMEAHCADGECAEGCQVDTDCYPGDACGAEGNCVTARCRETSVDCGFGEFCDVSTGDCYQGSGVYCSTCQDDADCGGNGNLCLNFGANGRFCGTECQYETDCPSGFTCLGIRDEFGNIFTNQCATYCWLYTDDPAGPPPPNTSADSLGLMPEINQFDGVPSECPAEVQ